MCPFAPGGQDGPAQLHKTSQSQAAVSIPPSLCIRDMRNPGFVSNSGLPEERSWPHTCACFPTYEPTLGPNPIQPGAQTNKSVAEGVAVRNDVVSTMSEEWRKCHAEHGKLPEIKDFAKFATRNLAEMDEDSFKFCWVEILPKAVGAKQLTEEKKFFGTPCTMQVDNKFIVSASNRGEHGDIRHNL